MSSRALNDSYEGAAELAAWKSRVTAGWSDVRIDHLETEGLPDAPEIGGALDLRVFVSLGSLSPEDVDVQVVHGRVKGEDELVDTTTTTLEVGETYEHGRYRFDGHITLERAGSFGYTVRDAGGEEAEGVVRIGVLSGELSDVAPITYSDHVTAQLGSTPYLAALCDERTITFGRGSSSACAKARTLSARSHSPA